MHLPPSAIRNRGRPSSKAELVVTMGEDRIAIPRSGAEKPGLRSVESGHPALLSGALSTSQRGLDVPAGVSGPSGPHSNQRPRPLAEWQEGGSLWRVVVVVVKTVGC